MNRRIALVGATGFLLAAAYFSGRSSALLAHGAEESADTTYSAPLSRGTVPKGYGRLAAVIPDQIGTGLIFEDNAGVIRFVSMTGMTEGTLARYDDKPTQGGIPRSYGHLVSAVVNPKGTALVFEDKAGVIRFVTMTGKEEGELVRN
jgi:hypothetical protein